MMLSLCPQKLCASLWFRFPRTELWRTQRRASETQIEITETTCETIDAAIHAHRELHPYHDEVLSSVSSKALR